MRTISTYRKSGRLFILRVFWHWDIPHRFGRGMTIGIVLFVFVPCVAGPFCRALGRNVASAAYAALVVGSCWTATFFLLFLYTRESVAGLIYVADWFFPALFVAILATISMARRLGPRWAVGPLGTGLLCGLIGTVAVVASKEAALNYPKPLDPLILGPDMITFNKCSQGFFKSNPEKGYPESLEELGPQGTSCVPEALLKGQVEGFTIAYEPGAKDANGKIASYGVAARETSPLGKDTSSIFTDQSGLVRVRFDGPHGNGVTSDLPSPSMNLQEVLSCIGNVSTANFGGQFPQPRRILSERNQSIRHCLGNPYVNRSFTSNQKFSQRGYDFEFNLIGSENEVISGFIVVARPQPYGVAGVRSYLAVGTIDTPARGYGLNVYATPEDRPANSNDPLATASEVGLQGVGPLATIVH